MLPLSAEVRRRERLSTAKTMLEYSGISVDVDDATISMARRLSDATGRKILFYRSKSGENGYYSKGDRVIWINANSKNPVAQIIAHELTHSVEFADAYGELSALVQARIARMGSSIEQLLQAKKEQYAEWGEELDDQGAMQEVVAEYVEKNLLTDEKAIAEMARNNSMLVQKIVDFFDSLLARLQSRLGASGTQSQERAKIRQMRDTFWRALQQTRAGNGVSADAIMGRTGEAYAAEKLPGEEFSDAVDMFPEGLSTTGKFMPEGDSPGGKLSGEGVQYSIGKTADNRMFVIVEEDILAGVSENDWTKTVKTNLKKKFPNGIAVGNDQIKVNAQTTSEITSSENSKWLRDNSLTEYADKFRATNNADELLRASENWVGEELKHPRKDNIKEFARGTVLMRIGKNDYSADVVVGTTKNNSMVLYDIVNIKSTSIRESAKRRQPLHPQME